MPDRFDKFGIRKFNKSFSQYDGNNQKESHFYAWRRVMRKVLFLSVLMLMLSSMPVFAQGQGAYSLDHVDGLWNTDTLNINSSIVFHIRVENDTEASATGITAGLEIMSPDGALWNTTTGAETGAINVAHFEQTFINPFSITGSGADTIGFSAFRIFSRAPLRATIG